MTSSLERIKSALPTSLKRRALPFAVPILTASVIATKGRSVARIQHARAMTKRAIVIGGCGRSGTTLLLSVLSCHPRIFAIGDETAALCPQAYAENVDFTLPLRMDIIYRHLLTNDTATTRKRWCEKTPKNVLFFRRLIDELGPGARFIHVVRDGRDVVTSRHPEGRNRYWSSPDRWVQEVSAGRQLESHPQVKLVRYEDLVTSYEATLRDLCIFLDEPFSEAFLRYPETANVQGSAESNAWFHGRQKPHAGSIGKWRDPELRPRVEELLGYPGAIDLLKHYGYDV